MVKIDEKKDRKRLLYVGINPTFYSSGTGRLAHQLISRFLSKYDVYAAGWGCDGQEENYICPIVKSGERWWEAVEAVRPDVIFLSHDIFRFPQLYSLRDRFRKERIKIIGYFPIDCDCISARWVKILESCDGIIVPSYFARRAIEKRYTKKPVYVVPEGVDHSLFKYTSKANAKEMMDGATRASGGDIYIRDKFVVLFSGRNQSKKNVSAVLDIFSIFARDKDDTVLVLLVHSSPIDIFGEIVFEELDLGDLYPWRKIKNKLVLVDKDINENSLVKLYSCSDALLFPTMGEGFGLPVLEAMTVGSIPVIPNYSASAEIPVEYFSLPFITKKAHFNANRAVVDVCKGAKVLEDAYIIWKYYPAVWNRMVTRNIERSLTFSWDKCAGTIVGIIDSILSGDVTASAEVKKI
jgi:glycosyltransferase involved in cell wall biosynthesis